MSMVSPFSFQIPLAQLWYIGKSLYISHISCNLATIAYLDFFILIGGSDCLFSYSDILLRSEELNLHTILYLKKNLWCWGFKIFLIVLYNLLC